MILMGRLMFGIRPSVCAFAPSLLKVNMSMTMVVDYFQSSLLPHLRSILSQSLEGQEYALFQALEDSKTRIVAFGNLKPKNARERQDIESGNV